jgi:multiple sugar transport system permease protein
MSVTIAAPNRLTAALPYIYVSVAAFYLVLFVIAPLGKGLLLSITDTNLITPNRNDYVGTANYSRFLGDPGFWRTVATTLIYATLTVVISLVLGIIAALAVNRRFRGIGIVRAILISPWAVPSVAVYLVFRWMYNDSSGVLNRVTTVLGMGQYGWLTDPSMGMFSVVLATVWKTTPFAMLIVLAALQSVPNELYEAADLDGADKINTFRTVVLPHIMPTMLVVVLLTTIWALRRFEIIYLLTGGGPGDATKTLVVSIFQSAFMFSSLSDGATLGVLSLVPALVVTLVYFYFDRRAARTDQGGRP